jgi:hypothetical protein
VFNSIITYNYIYYYYLRGKGVDQGQDKSVG